MCASSLCRTPVGPCVCFGPSFAHFTAANRPECADITATTAYGIEKDMTRTTLGIIIGLALGLALAFGSVGQMLLVALFCALGVIVAKVLDGDIDLSRYVAGRRDR
jgi:hypothetical protein